MCISYAAFSITIRFTTNVHLYFVFLLVWIKKSDTMMNFVGCLLLAQNGFIRCYAAVLCSFNFILHMSCSNCLNGSLLIYDHSLPGCSLCLCMMVTFDKGHVVHPLSLHLVCVLLSLIVSTSLSVKFGGFMMVHSAKNNQTIFVLLRE